MQHTGNSSPKHKLFNVSEVSAISSGVADLSIDTDEQEITEASSGSLICECINRPCAAEEEHHGARPKTSSSCAKVGGSSGSPPKTEDSPNPNVSSTQPPHHTPEQHAKISPEEQEIFDLVEGRDEIKESPDFGEKIQGKHLNHNSNLS